MKTFYILVSTAVMLSACKGADAHDAGTSIKFSAPVAASRASNVGTAPMFAISPAGHEAIVWVSDTSKGTDGRLYVSIDSAAPVSIADPIGPIEAHGEAPPKLAYGADGSLNIAYVVGKEIPGRRFPAAALRFVRSTDGGKTWDAPVTVTDDSVFGSHNFHALHAAQDGTIYVSWLDGRHGKSAAYVTRSTDGGKTWAPNVRAGMGEACPCCRTNIATTSDGTLYLAWRQVYPGNVRDVVVASSKDKGTTWSEPVKVHEDNWVFDACPHAGPSLQVDAQGRVHVAWWTGKEGSAGVYYAQSTDGAKTFSAPIPLGVAHFSRPAHVQLALGTGADSNVVATVWDDGTKQTPEIALRMSRDGGKTFGPAEVLSAAGKAAAFPVLGLSSKGLTVAWSEEDAESAAKEAEAHAHMNMKDPKMVMKLEAVGDAQVMVRRGVLQ